MSITYTQMPAASTLTGTEIVPLVQSGANVRSTLNDIKAFVSSTVAQLLSFPLNLAISIPTTGATATITADQITLSRSLGGASLSLGSFSQVINLGITGAGGMDTGTATSPGFVAVYAIYNPTTLATSTLATLATAAAAPEIYGGANMPSGYVYSRLLTVWPIGTTGNFAVGYQQDRTIYIAEIAVTTGLAVIAYTSVSLATQVPKNAKTFSGRLFIGYGGGAPQPIYKLSPQGTTTGNQQFTSYIGNAIVSQTGALVTNMPIVTPQVTFYSITGQAFTSANLYITSYTI